MADKQKIDTAPYKGVRDFYPEDMAVQNYIFDTWRKVVERYGYAEYNASILEPAELYRAKSGEEIINEQMYVFTDRGEREVALRPEMTPSVARMVAAREHDLPFPLRWYSIPNLFRYERPQRGRLREHWQLNVDLFGLSGIEAEAEIILLASKIMEEFGFKPEQFEIRIYDRVILSYVFSTKLQLNTEEGGRLQKLLDKRRKIDKADFEQEGLDILGEERLRILLEWVENPQETEKTLAENEAVSKNLILRDTLKKLGISNVVWDPGIVRGFDYYTGMVFEVFDKNPANNRSLFGGGRYDKLVDMFGGTPIPAVGFGMGDVTIRDVLETYDLIPPKIRASKTNLYICVLAPEYAEAATTLAQILRGQNVNVAVNYTYKKIGAQITLADKQKIPYVLCIGEEEIKTKRYKVKKLSTGEEVETEEEGIKNIVLNS